MMMMMMMMMMMVVVQDSAFDIFSGNCISVFNSILVHNSSKFCEAIKPSYVPQ